MKGVPVLQMPSSRRSRGVVLTCLSASLILAYYLDLFGLLVREDTTRAAGQHVVAGEISTPPITPPISYTSPSSTSAFVPQTTSWEQKSVVQTTSTSTTIAASPTSFPSSSKNLTSSDVLLIFKTGASTIWRRMPLHLLTTLTQNTIPNHVLYSDLSEPLTSSISALDILVNVSSLINTYDPAAYFAYLDQQAPEHINTYREHAKLPGDEPREQNMENAPAWKLDKYKFLPMLEHAARNWSGLKWYLYIEDDSYIFWDNVLHYLSTLDEEEVSYWGAFSGDGNATFAQGGSGIAFSGGLMKKLFGEEGKGPSLAGYANETAQACCGDIMLGKILSDYDIKVNKGDWGSIGWRPEPPWRTVFDDRAWCERVLTFHHLHQRDLVVLGEVESRVKGEGRKVLFRDIYLSLISPHLTNSSRSNWDNFASKYTLTNTTTVPPPDLQFLPPSLIETATSSPETCQEACLQLKTCMSWRHDSAKQRCALDTVIRLGREPDPQPFWEEKTSVSSGWVLERVEERLLGEKCGVV